jgi:hypothetical protein
MNSDHDEALAAAAEDLAKLAVVAHAAVPPAAEAHAVVAAEALAVAAPAAEHASQPELVAGENAVSDLFILEIGALTRAQHIVEAYTPATMTRVEYTDSGNIIDGDAVVIDRPEVEVVYSYPFTKGGPSELERQLNCWVFKEVAPDGKSSFTRKDIVDAILNRYEAIYAREAETSSIRVGTVEGSYNRNKTNGDFGIFGHVISDLVVEQVVYCETKGACIPVIGS